MMSQRAPPDVNGFGTTTSLSPLATSSQVWMSFGLPLRVMNTTVESWMMPLYWLSVQSSGTRPASTRRATSGSIAKWTRSAGWPASTARDWSPEAPNEFEKSTSAPSGVSLKPGSSVLSYASCGEE